MKTFLIALKLGITAALLGLVFSRIDRAAVGDALRSVSPLMLAVAFALITVQGALAAERWHFILRFLGTACPFGRVMGVFWIGLFFTALLFGALTGDGMRMWILARERIGLSKVVDSVLLDRIAALAGLVVLVAASLPFLDDRILVASVRDRIAAALGVGIAGAYLIGCFARLPEAWDRVGLLRGMRHLLNDLRLLCRPPFRALGLGGLSVFVTFCDSIKIFLLMRGFHVEIGLVDCFVLSPLVILALTMPISIGGWGVREAVMVGLFGTLGVPAAVSLSVSILLGILSMAVSVPGAAVWLWWRNDIRKSMPRAAAEAQS
jgi:glycosyltransferase 2 family protein